jgi:hypothetical protein
LKNIKHDGQIWCLQNLGLLFQGPDLGPPPTTWEQCDSDAHEKNNDIQSAVKDEQLRRRRKKKITTLEIIDERRC